jgi:hypothetical protein
VTVAGKEVAAMKIEVRRVEEIKATAIHTVDGVPGAA